jgi:quercetin dioxygenase-like cupin family protein
MVVVNETQGDETTSQQDAGFEGTPELTNRWFRAYRVTLGPGQASPAHRHRAPVVVFQAIPGKGLGVGPMRWEFNEPGQWAFFDVDAPHELRNTGTAPLELVEVEVRRK